MWQVMAAGTLLNMYGQYKSSQEEAKSLLNQANMTRAKGEESWRRYEYNADLEKENLRQTVDNMGVKAAASGVGGQIVSKRQSVASEIVAKNLSEMRKEAIWDKKMADTEADTLERNARSMESAGGLGTLGTGLSGVGQMYSIYKGR